MFDSNIQVKQVVKQLCEITTPDKKSVRLNWEDIDNQTLEHFKPAGTRQIANERRFLSGDKYQTEFSKKFVEGANPLHIKGKWNGADGILVYEKLGIRSLDEVFDDMTVKHNYDNDGCDSEDRETQVVFDEYKEILLSQSKTFAERVASAVKQDQDEESEQEDPAPSTQAGARRARVATHNAEGGAEAGASKPKAKQGGGASAAKAKAEGKAKGGAKAKAKPKGRPPRSILNEATELCSSFAAAQQDNALWWGSEGKTQLKRLVEIKKQFHARIQAATEPDLITSYEPAHKKVGVLALLLEAYQQSGWDSQAFMEVYDCCLVSLRMPPAVSLEMPKWLLWARHTWSIKSTADNSMWLQCVGLQALVQNGAQQGTAGRSQVELLATRVLSIVRSPAFEEVKKGLAALFHPIFSTDDFDDETRDFWQALQIYLHRHTLKLAKRLALMEEASEYFTDEAQGTLCSALCALPRGREILDEGRAHVRDCRTSSDQLKKWKCVLDRCSTALDGTLNEAKDQLALTVHNLDLLSINVEDVMKTFTQTNEVVLEEFALKAFDNPVQGIVVKFLNAFLNSFIAFLTPLMKNDLNLRTLLTWYEDDQATPTRTCLKTLARDTVSKAHVLWSTDIATIISRQVRAAESILFFFEKAAQLPPCGVPRLDSDGVVSEADSHRMVRVLKEDFTLEFANTDFRTAIGALLLAPLLQREGDLIPRLAEVARAQSTRVAKRILEKMSVLMSVGTPVNCIPTLDVTQPKKFEDFQALLCLICFH